MNLIEPCFDPFGILAAEEAREAREEFIEKETDELINRWKAEISKTGIILDLGWEWAEIKAYSIETNQIYSTCTPMWTHLRQLARERIEGKLNEHQ